MNERVERWHRGLAVGTRRGSAHKATREYENAPDGLHIRSATAGLADGEADRVARRVEQG